MLDSNQGIVIELSAKLSTAVKSILENFYLEHPTDNMYAFALVAPAEGTSISCSIATEQTLSDIAQWYALQGYEAKSGDTLTILRQLLRWANPDDGWYFYSFQEDEPILTELNKAFDSKIIKMFDGTTEVICIEALRQLDRDGAFGIGEIRQQITLGFTYGEDPEDFVKFAAQLNSPDTVWRTQRELKDSYDIGKNIKTPYN